MLEDAGIYYYFRHEHDRHVLVMVDNQAAHPKEADCQRLPYHSPGAHGSIEEEHIYGWSVMRDLQPSAVAGADYHFTAPTQNLHKDVGRPGRTSEVFEYPGNGYGMWAIPRIGQEVVVEFLEGDPDRPLVTGCVYNGDNRPPFDADATHFGIRSRSTKVGGPQHFSEIRFDDRHGQEELFIQAQNKHTTVVKGPQTTTIARSRVLAVGGDESITVMGRRNVHVDKQDVQFYKDCQQITVMQAFEAAYAGGRNVTVSAPADNELVGAPKTTKVGGDYEIATTARFCVKHVAELSSADDNAHVLLTKNQVELSNKKAQVVLLDDLLTLRANKQIALVCGDAGVVLQSDGTVTIYGKTLEFKASTRLCLQAAEGKGAIELAGAGVSISGAKATLSSAETTEITGQVVRIN